MLLFRKLKPGGTKPFVNFGDQTKETEESTKEKKTNNFMLIFLKTCFL
jgi:hypothetical protein